MCPDGKLNLQPFGVWNDAPTNGAPPGQGEGLIFLCSLVCTWCEPTGWGPPDKQAPFSSVAEEQASFRRDGPALGEGGERSISQMPSMSPMNTVICIISSVIF